MWRMTAPATRMTPEAYLALDAASETKVEYYDGVIVAMAGASPRPNRVAGNLYVALRRALDPRGCYVAQTDQRVRLRATRAYVYPDVVAACAPRFEAPRPQSLVNPELVVEVLSSSTESHDLSGKLAHYRGCASIQEIVFVHLAERLIEHHRRVEENQWLVSLVREGGLELAGATLTVDEAYAGIDTLPPDADETAAES